MKLIHKYSIDPQPFSGQPFRMAMPHGAEILDVQIQGVRTGQKYIPVIWALVDPDKALTSREFVAYWTGSAVTKDSKYIGTWQLEGLVWHLFDMGER